MRISFGKYFSLLCFLSIAPACDDSWIANTPGDIGRGVTETGTLVVDTKATMPRLVLAPEPRRLTAGEGAKKEVLSLSGPAEGIVLLPVFIPIAAAWGAATVPNDEQWAEIMRKHRARNQLNAQQARPFLQIAGGLDARNLFENALADGFESGFSEQPPCISTRSSPRACPNAAAAPRLAVQLVSLVSDARLTGPGNRSRKTGLTFATEAWVVVTLPAQQATRCHITQLIWDLPQGDNSPTPAQIRAMVAEQYRALGRFTAFILYWNEGSSGHSDAVRQAIGRDEFKPGFPPLRGFEAERPPACALTARRIREAM